MKAGGDPGRAVVSAIRWSHDKLRFGMTHAFAAAEGWLRLHDRLRDDPERALVAVVEPIAYMAFDSLREPARPFTPIAPSSISPSLPPRWRRRTSRRQSPWPGVRWTQAAALPGWSAP